MSIVTFWSNSNKECGQTMSMLAVATNLAIEHNFKILVINTKYEDYSIEEAYWKQNPQTLNNMITGGKVDLNSGISGLTKALLSNKTSPEIITNYTKTVFKGRLEVLTDKKVTVEEYEKQRKNMKTIIQMANKYYDLVFVDLSGDLSETEVQAIIEISNLLIVNLKQSYTEIEKFMKSKDEDGILRKNNIMLLIGKYDELSKYNVRNVATYLKEKRVYSIPYNTQYSEKITEGEIVDFLMKFNNIKMTNPYYNFINSIKEFSNDIIEKLKELQRTK